MGIMDTLREQQQEFPEQQPISEILSALLVRLDGIETNQHQVVKASNEATQSVSRVWVELEQMQRLLQSPPAASGNDSHGKTLTTLANTQKDILELLGHTKRVVLPDGTAVRASDLSAHTLMQKVTAGMESLMTTSSRLADAVSGKRAVNIDYEKLAGYLVPRLDVQLATHERSLRAAMAETNVPMHEELEKSRTALSETGTLVTTQVRRSVEQVEKLREVVMWRTIGRVATALMPHALAVFVVFGTAQTLWAAFGLQPIVQTVWGAFLAAQEWYWKLVIAGGSFVALAAFGWLTWRLGTKLHGWYKDY